MELRGRPRARRCAIHRRPRVAAGVRRKLTNRHEAERREPWKVTDAPADYIDKQLGAIIGLEIPITRLVGKWKVSQNRPPQDRDGVVEGLLQEGGHAAAAIAKLVRQSRSE